MVTTPAVGIDLLSLPNIAAEAIRWEEAADEEVELMKAFHGISAIGVLAAGCWRSTLTMPGSRKVGWAIFVVIWRIKFRNGKYFEFYEFLKHPLPIVHVYLLFFLHSFACSHLFAAMR